MTSKLMLLAGAAALVFVSAAAEPPHGPKCPPGQQHCMNGPHAGPMGGPAPTAAMRPAPGPVFRGGPGWNKGPADWQWQDDRGGWHRDHDRYWRPNFRGGFLPMDRLFVVLRQHSYNRVDGEPYWFRGRFVVKTFDRRGRPVIVELNPYTGDFIGIVRF
jgi:hypothetical protein